MQIAGASLRKDVSKKSVLGQAFRDVVSWYGWTERMNEDPSRGIYFIGDSFSIGSDSFVWTLLVDERSQLAYIHVTAPISVPEVRAAEVAMVANCLNMRCKRGHFYVSEDARLCFKWSVCIVNQKLERGLMQSLRATGARAFKSNFNTFLTAAFTNRTLEKIIERHEFLRGTI